MGTAQHVSHPAPKVYSVQACAARMEGFNPRHHRGGRSSIHHSYCSRKTKRRYGPIMQETYQSRTPPGEWLEINIWESSPPDPLSLRGEGEPEGLARGERGHRSLIPRHECQG